MKRFPSTRRLAVLSVAALAVVGTILAASPAQASTSSTGALPHRVCKGGAISSGTYASLTVKGVCWIPDGANVTVRGNLYVAPGAQLNGVDPTFTLAWFNMARIHVRGNVIVGAGAILGLGCTPAMANDPFFPFPKCSPTHNADVVVGGDLIAANALTIYLDGITVHGNLVSAGGGPGRGPDVTQENPAFNYVIKDSTIGHDLVVTGWRGGWNGSIRNHVGRNLVYVNNKGLDPDANEIITNVVGGNLVCFDNVHAAQYGDAQFVPGAAPNVVGGRALGECRSLTKPFVT